MATVLIKNGRIVTAVDDYQADILIEDGRIRTIGQGLVVGNHVETALRRQLLTAFRHQGGFIRFDGAGNVNDGIGRGHFQIQPMRNDPAQEIQIAILNVASILAEVNGDAVGAAEDSQDGGRRRVGLLGLPRLPHGSHVVDVDAQTNHGQ